MQGPRKGLLLSSSLLVGPWIRQQIKMGAGMLVALLSSFLVDPAFSTPFSSSTIDPFRAGSGSTGNDGGDNPGDDGGGTMREWSSTIGIVTAIVGNVLISFALNIQRYAHIRIEREYERTRQRNGWKRTASERASGSERLSSSNYGTLSNRNQNADEEAGHTNGARAETNGRGTRDSEDISRLRFQRYTDDEEGDADHAAHDDRPGHDRLQQSFMSDRTVTPMEKNQATNERKSYLRSPYWWAGIILMTVGEAGNFLAYGFAPASIVSPLGVVALISNCIIAPFMLKETFRRRDMLGVLVAVAGAVTIVLSAKSSETKIGPGEIWGMITRWEFELYLGLTVALILGLMWVSKEYGRKSILIDLGLVGLFGKSLRCPVLDDTLFLLISLGGYTALSTKGVASLLSFTLWHVITFPITYALVAILVFSALMQIRYINRALQRFDSTQVIPTQFVLFTISVIVGSAVLYRDFESMTLSRGGKFIGGCALTFSGVYLITSGRDRGEDSESESDEEESIGLLGAERYRDSVDWQEEGRQNRPEQALDGTATGVEITRSPPRSLLSDEDINDDDGLQTPRAQLSSGPSSIPSISGESSLSPSRDISPQQLTENPWSLSPNERFEAQPAESAPPFLDDTRPQTPHQVYPPPTQLLLRFPSAPGLTESPPRTTQQTPTDSPAPATPPQTNTPQTTSRRQTFSRTPGSGKRNSLSKRFAPGPFLPPLSGTLSAVVAESRRRGEGSPRSQRDRPPSRKRKGKKRSSNPALGDAAAAIYGPEAAVETEYETDASINGAEEDGGHGNNRMSPRLPGLITANRTRTQERVPTLFGSPLQSKKDHSRTRSLSDSWSGGLGWLSGSIRGKGRRGGKKGDNNNKVDDASQPAEAQAQTKSTPAVGTDAGPSGS
ncbi:hypothetical protein FQN50_006175 [Emmonsiellopsis sp. PD_5]|nr:hypothetical protein FQN50_006175 [Emmonsiellopsis sp. PD_5]